MVATPCRRLALASAFAAAARKYWLGVFPHVGREARHWRMLAAEINDPTLRRLALATHETERGNLDGAAAFAVLVPRAHRAHVVRAVVAFQATYDYIDTLAEQPCVDPVANGHQLHLALLAALDPHADHPDYYAYNSAGGDGGYIRDMIDACRNSLGALPSYRSVAAPAQRAAQRMVAYQSFNHDGAGVGPRTLASWAVALTPPGSGLRWWETAAAAASSLTVFALIAAAAHPVVSAVDAIAIERAYFPWIGALHVLLDSLIDRAADLDAGHHSLVAHYGSVEEAASRLAEIARRALHAAETLRAGTQHALILAAMTSFYMSAPCASAPAASLAVRQIRDAMGMLATPTLLVLYARRTAGRVLARDGAGLARPGRLAGCA